MSELNIKNNDLLTIKEFLINFSKKTSFDEQMASFFIRLFKLSTADNFDFNQFDSLFSLRTTKIYKEKDVFFWFDVLYCLWLKTIHGVICIERVSYNWRVVTYNNVRVCDSFNNMPSILEFDKNVNLSAVIFKKNNKLHRINKPAYIRYRLYNGEEDALKQWWVNGKLHNITGPAIIEKRCNIYMNHYYINGQLISEREFVENLLSRRKLLDGHVKTAF